METLETIKKLVSELDADASKFFTKGTNAAGTRARKTAQLLKDALQKLRVEILNERKKESE